MAAWIARGAWALVAIIGGAAVEGALADRSDAVRWAAGVGCWTLWGVVMAAFAVPSVRSLTIARVGAPLSLAVAVIAETTGANAVDLALLTVPAAVACVAIFTADCGRAFVQASSYGDEERLPLRFPVAAGSAAIVMWVIWAPALLLGPIFIASGNLIVGGILTLLAIAGVILLVPKWHRLSRRWLVLVPAGLVVHDPVVLADTLMVRTDQLAGMRLATADTKAADLTGPASGFAIEVQASETVTAVFAFTPQEPNGRAIHMTGFLISPSRPGEALRTAAGRGIPVS